MTVLDATLGYGGHAQGLLRRIVPCGNLTGIDVDPIELPPTESRLRALGFEQDVLTIRRLKFAGKLQIPRGPDERFDIVIADLGVSSI